MAKADGIVYYWRWPYRVIPTVITIPLALFFTAGCIGLGINIVKEASDDGWSAGLMMSGLLGLAILGLLSATFIAWPVAALRAGRFHIHKDEILLPKFPISPLAIFPRRVPFNRLVAIDFDEESLQNNEPPIVSFAIKMSKPFKLKLSRYGQPDVVHDYLKQQLSDLATRLSGPVD